MYSEEHKKYLKNIKKNNILVLTFQISIVLTILIIWQLLADLKIINTFISSSPKGIFETLINLIKSNNYTIDTVYKLNLENTQIQIHNVRNDEFGLKNIPVISFYAPNYTERMVGRVLW